MQTRPLSSLLPVSLLSAVLLGACAGDAVAPTPVPPNLPASPPQAEGWSTPAPVETGYELDPDGAPRAFAFEVREGRAITQGDVDVGPAAAVPRTPDAARRAAMSLGLAPDGGMQPWPEGRVPYVVDPSLPSPQRVAAAVAHVEQAMGGLVDFVPRTTETAYVRVVPSTGCSSSIGRIGTVQYVRLSTACGTGSTVHELLHALGLIHEHARCNRDAYVRVEQANVQLVQTSNFGKVCTGLLEVDTYDEGSIMHYPPTAFSVNGLPTIVSLRGLDWMMGQRVAMSAGDVDRVAALYGR